MKNKLLFLIFIFLMHLSFASNKTIYSSHKNTIAIDKINKSASIFGYSISAQKEITSKKSFAKKKLSGKEKQRNFFMRIGLQIIGTFVFLFVLFLVFRMKKK